MTIYDAVDVGWIARVKESLPHKEVLAAAMVDGLNAAAGRVTERQGARLLTGGSPDEGDAGSLPAPSALPTSRPRVENALGGRPRHYVAFLSCGHRNELRDSWTPVIEAPGWQPFEAYCPGHDTIVPIDHFEAVEGSKP